MNHTCLIRCASAVLVLSLWVGTASNSPADDLQTTVEVDVSQAGPAINPFVYGQFIEHMGRCIRDGIWAEMLQDRKFLLEPGKTWQKTGPEAADFEAVHDTAGAFCGGHCMAVWVRDAAGGDCGICQGSLGLVKDR